ncbi:glycoside hydrolase/deacetylase [Ceraceosorus guamensis]|uniref:chitin deacetylase n=1 Tax=Ceraceosorus guamensis TaxID=1522189 RepID=A0A316W3K8_9BASI|nr:glycoside hydrolase/deacetylase [Ceraceosorus guamensis]PWN44289.1 glycoside hydrolase/deacetylase [Ceraceosorus guamensis]
MVQARSGSHDLTHKHDKRGGCILGTDHLRPRDVDEATLKKRQATLPAVSGNGQKYPTPGEVPPPSSLPQAWVDAYNKAKKAGQIPDIPASKETPDGLIAYPKGTDMNAVCSWTLSKCNDGDIWQAPQGTLAFGFDDGPTPNGTPPLIDLIKKENIATTHFLIGSAIAWAPDVMSQLAAVDSAHLGIHTWSHTLQSTKSDLEILGDLGWTQQIIYDLTGKVPAYFRPPEGDADARVRAIARVLGMQTVLWTKDADDWCLRQGHGTATSIQSCVQSAPDLETVTKEQVSWVSGSKNDGVITLEHETTDQAIKAAGSLVNAAQKNKQYKIVGAIPDLWDLPWYSNQFAQGDKPTKPKDILPTHSFVNVTDGGAGSAQYDLGDWKSATSTGSAKAGATSSASKGNSNSATTGGSSSGAPATAAASFTVLLGAAALAASLAL